MRSQTRRYVTKAYLTFVAVDEHGKPRAVPKLVLETEDDKRRNEEAIQRRSVRLKAAGRA
jgi:acyl-CoA hydrolase